MSVSDAEDNDKTTKTQLDFSSKLQRFAYRSSPDKPVMSARRNGAPAASAKDELDNQTPRGKSQTTRKRPINAVASQPTDSPSPKKKRSTTKERSLNDPHNPTSNLVDSVYPGLILVFIGLNPGLTTAETGHAYAHKSNRFWPLLHESGITTQRHDPSETHDLPELYRIGNTNICLRPTRSGDGLTKQELEEGAVVLETKIAQFKPEAVCIVGKSIWETIWKVKTGSAMKKPAFKWGWQDEEMWLGRTIGEKGEVEWPGARTFVATSTSGLAANLSPKEKLEIWKPLGEWFTNRRKEVEERDGPYSIPKSEEG